MKRRLSSCARVLFKEVDLLEHGHGFLDVGLKISPHHIEHLDQQQVAYGIKNLIAFFSAGDDVFRTQDGKMLRGIGLFETQSLDDGPRRKFSVSKYLDNGNTSRVRQGLKDAGFKLPKSVRHIVVLPPSL